VQLHLSKAIDSVDLTFTEVPVHVVANRLGHADASVTLRVYARVLRQDTADVGDVFASAV
jgi:integrase